jgi:hypothetical protein
MLTGKRPALCVGRAVSGTRANDYVTLIRYGRIRKCFARWVVFTYAYRSCFFHGIRFQFFQQHSMKWIQRPQTRLCVRLSPCVISKFLERISVKFVIGNIKLGEFNFGSYRSNTITPTWKLVHRTIWWYMTCYVGFIYLYNSFKTFYWYSKYLAKCSAISI